MDSGVDSKRGSQPISVMVWRKPTTGIVKEAVRLLGLWPRRLHGQDGKTLPLDQILQEPVLHQKAFGRAMACFAQRHDARASDHVVERTRCPQSQS